MKKEYLSLTGNYALDVLSYYIWGKKDRPSDIADEKYANRNIDKNGSRIEEPDITLNVSTNEFMSRYFQINTVEDFKQYVAKIPMFELFFKNKHRFGKELKINPNEYKKRGNQLILTHEEFVEIFYGIDKTNENEIINSANNPNISFSMYKQDPDRVEDFAQAAFVFGSSNFTFNYSMNNYDFEDKVEYVFNINEDGSITPSHIENLKFTLDIDNFDFESGSPLAKMINPTLKKITDPNDIGKKVKIEFINDFYPNDKDINLTLTAEEFFDLKTTKKNLTDSQILSMWEKFAKAYFDYFEKIAKSNIIDYSSDGKYLIYGNKNNNIINGTITKDGVDLKDDMTIRDNLPILEKAASYFWESIEVLSITQGISITKEELIERGKKLDLLSKLSNNLNPHKDRLDNGIIYLLGEGKDMATGTNKDDILVGGDDSDTLNGGEGNDILIAGNRTKDNKDNGTDNSSNILSGGDGDDTLYGSNGDDTLYGDENTSWLTEITGNITDIFIPKGSDTIHGGKGNDIIVGGLDNDYLYGEDGNDTIYGGDDSDADTLSGGEGYDTYYVGDKDIIYDDKDGEGKVVFNNITLNGGEYDKEKGCYLSDDKSIEYHLSGNTLIVKQADKTITIHDFDKNIKQIKGYGYLDDKFKKVA